MYSRRPNPPSDTSSVTQSTVGPLGKLSSPSDVTPLDDAHVHINDPSVYGTTSSLIHSAEKETATLRTIDPQTHSLDATTYQRDSTPPVRPEGALFTPQDAIIAHVFGRSVQPSVTDHPAPATPPQSSSAPQSSVLLGTSDSLPPPPSVQTPPSSNVRLGPSLSIYDPFSGAKLSERTPISPPSASAPRGLSSFAPIPAVDDHKLWSSLERILELQAEIAAMHGDMESVGGKVPGNNHGGGMGAGAGEGGHVGPRKRSKRGQTLLVGDEEPEEHEQEGGMSTGVAISEISTDHSDDDDEEEDIHGYGKKRRDEELAKLAEQLAQRKTAIGGIMTKLDDLSTALKTFHALPPPLFDSALTPSRSDTVSAALPNVSMASPPPPPLHTQPGQPLSPLFSISPSQAMSSITPSAASPSPPVPPISTLVPPVSSGAPITSPGLEPVVTAVQRIIPGVPHVESPADMDPAHFILQEMSSAHV